MHTAGFGYADGRLPIAEVYSAFDTFGGAGWQAHDIASQPAPGGGVLPIRAYSNAEEVDRVLVGGIHGREPAGVLALARCVPKLVERGRRDRLLVMPLLNPWGYQGNERYGPAGQSVSDSDHLLGRAAAPACVEAAAITGFVMNEICIRPGAAVLDLHEDPVYESPGYRFDGFGSYLYFVGAGAGDRPPSRRVLECLRRSALPLVPNGVTRFGETIADGAIVDTEDGSIDELFARRLACTPVITVENLLQGPDSPPLTLRVDVYVAVLEAFLG